ncbi:MAG TPA: S1 family peptidase [Catenuloplanes sp.]
MLAGAIAVVMPVALIPTAAAAEPGNQPAPNGGAAVMADRAGRGADMIDALAKQRGIGRAAAEKLLRAEDAAVDLADRLTTELGPKSGGAYLSDGKLVVTVTDSASAAKVAAAGAKARVVARGERQLQDIQRTLEAAPSEVDTTWGVDTAANQVVVTLPASGAKNAAQRSAARRFGQAVRFEAGQGSISPGVGISSGDALGGCTVGFTATDNSFNYIITAGHCTTGFPHWTLPNGQDVGPSLTSVYPGSDYGLIWMNGPAVWPTGQINRRNGTTESIHGWATAVPGLSLCKSGKTTGLTCGSVLRTGVTINSAGVGAVDQMVETNMCMLRGDSGGPLFSNHIAYGLNSHTNGVQNGTVCAATPRAYHQPVGEPITAYQIVIYGAP